MAVRAIDEGHLQALHDQGKTYTEIARVLKLPRSTVRDRLAKLTQSPPVETEPANGSPPAGAFMFGLDTLQDMAAWWQERQAALADAQDGDRVRRRITFFIEKRHEDAIRRQADIDGLTYTAIVNEALRQYFADRK